MKQTISFRIISWTLAALSLPTVCRADAINPITNLFTRDTVIPASILTILIIVIEATLLRWWVKPKLRFLAHLGRSTIINLISSATGSIVVAILHHGDPIWGLSSFFVPMFLLTLITETPGLKLLYRSNGLSWLQATKISVGINAVSYAFVFIFQFLLIFAYFGYASIADKQSLKKWNDAHLLDKESGYIYTVDYAPSLKYSKHVLKRYDVVSKTWSTIDPKSERGIDPIIWDLRGNILACILQTEDWENRTLSILRGPAYTPVTQIKGNFKEVRIAPDLKKIAVLEYIKEAVAPKDAKSHFMLGSACRLKVFDINTGGLLYETPDFALGQGLCWTNDSNTVLFSSLRDKTLFNHHDSTSHGYGRGYAKDGQFPIDLFAFDLATRTVRNIVEGMDPRIISSTGDITFLREKGMNTHEVWRYDQQTGKASLVIGGLYSFRHAVSPNGTRFLVQIPHRQPLGDNSFLTVIEANNARRKFILQSSSRYDFRWIP